MENDRHKFRFWDEEDKKYTYYNSPWNMIRPTTYEITEEGYDFNRPHEGVLEQCTGLSASKSYRGNKPEDLLIWEGDIDSKGRVVRYGDYEGKFAIGLFKQRAGIVNVIVSTLNFLSESRWEERVADNIIGYLSSVMGSAQHGYYLQDDKGGQYGLTKYNLSSIEIIGNAHKEAKA